MIEKIVGEAIAAHNGIVSMPVFKPGELIRRIGEAYDEQVMREVQAGLGNAVDVKESLLHLAPLNPNPKPVPEVSVVLCVRTRPTDIPPAAVQEFREAFPDNIVRLDYVNPQTPMDLDDMSQWPNVVAVYLQEQPLPSIVLKKGRTPCVLLRDGQLMQLLNITPSITPFVADS